MPTPTFEDIRTARIASIEAGIIRLFEANENSLLASHFAQWAQLTQAVTMSNAGGLTAAETTAAVVDALTLAELDKLPELISRSRHWEHVTAETLTLSADDTATTGLTVPATLAGAEDEDVQVVLTANLHPSVLNVYHGTPVAGLTEARAKAIAADTVRFGFGEVLGPNNGGRLSGLALLPETITSKANINKFEALSTSADYPATLSVNWYQRRFQ